MASCVRETGDSLAVRCKWLRRGEGRRRSEFRRRRGRLEVDCPGPCAAPKQAVPYPFPPLCSSPSPPLLLLPLIITFVAVIALAVFPSFSGRTPVDRQQRMMVGGTRRRLLEPHLDISSLAHCANISGTGTCACKSREQRGCHVDSLSTESLLDCLSGIWPDGIAARGPADARRQEFALLVQAAFDIAAASDGRTDE